MSSVTVSTLKTSDLEYVQMSPALMHCIVHSTFYASALNDGILYMKRLKSSSNIQINTSRWKPSVVPKSCLLVWSCSSQCLCQVSEAGRCRARAVSAHSTCGLTQSDRTWLSSTGSSPVEETHTWTETYGVHTNTDTKMMKMNKTIRKLLDH